MFIEMALEHRPSHAFTGGDFAAWQADTLPKVKACLGDWPGKVPANPELACEWNHDGLVKQRWLLDVGKHISAVLVVCKPADLKPGEKRPAILCWHGHGPYGKAPVIGDDSTPELRAQIQQHNYKDYPLASMAQLPHAVEVITVSGDGPPTGASFLAMPTAAPALANAVFRASAVRVRRLPLMKELLRLL